MTIRIIIQSQWGGLLAIDVAPPSRLQLLPCAQASALAADSFATDAIVPRATRIAGRGCHSPRNLIPATRHARHGLLSRSSWAFGQKHCGLIPILLLSRSCHVRNSGQFNILEVPVSTLSLLRRQKFDIAQPVRRLP